MKKRVQFYVLMLCLIACVSESDFSVPKVICEEQVFQITHSIAQVKEMAGYGITTFNDELIIEGYVVTTDESGNIYKSISIQDRPKDPTCAIGFSVDKTNLYGVFPVGRKIYVKLKDLSIGYNRGALVLGKAVGAELERIPNSEVFNHFIRSCENVEIVPNVVSMNAINDTHLETLIQLNGVQFRNEDLGNSYGELNSTKSVDRVLHGTNSDCELDAQINVRISGFSNFKNKELPEGKGSVVGILTKYYSEYQLVLRSEKEVKLEEERCAIVTSNKATISYEEIIDRYSDKVTEFGIDRELIFEGYVVSSDQEGNFTNTLCIQDAMESPIGGFQLLIEEENIFETFQVGDKVLLKLNYLYLDKIEGVYTLGVFKEDSVGEIIEEEIGRYLFNTGENFEIIPQIKTLEGLSVNDCQNTLVTIKNVQLSKSELGKAFAYYSGVEEGHRILEKCDVLQNLHMVTLGTASFANNQFPIGRGEITGVLYREETQLKIQIRSINDVEFQDERETCDIIESKILITEVADPENNVGARFIELYNAGEGSVSLNGWRLHKYLNGSTTVSGSGVGLSGLEIPSKGFLIVSNNAFQTIFNMFLSLESSYISGNGDDVYELIDRQGAIHDVYGVKGEDGSGTAWEYLDGKAVRKLEITEPNSGFEISEWEIFTKTSGNKQLAPENFTPNVR
jgi:hypothetical protein